MIEERVKRDIRLHVSRNLSELSLQAARFFEEIHAKAENRFYIVPGGRTPARFFEDVARLVTDWRATRFLLSDERLVDRDDPRSNQKLFVDQFMSNVSAALKPSLFPFDTQALMSDTAQNRLGEMAAQLSAWGKPELAVLGIGSDGHTASLFTGDDGALASSTQPWRYCKNLDEPFGRISLTFDALRQAKQICFLVSGADKASALADCLEGDFLPRRYPAQMILQGFDQRIDIFCDEAATCSLHMVEMYS